MAEEDGNNCVEPGEQRWRQMIRCSRASSSKRPSSIFIFITVIVSIILMMIIIILVIIVVVIIEGRVKRDAMRSKVLEMSEQLSARGRH